MYLNLAVCEYASIRLVPGKAVPARNLRARLRRVLADAGVMAPVVVRGKGIPSCVEALMLDARDGRRLLAVRMNALSSPELMQMLGERGVRELTLEFPTKVGLVDLRTGEDLGRSARFTRSLDPFEALLFAVEEQR